MGHVAGVKFFLISQSRLDMCWGSSQRSLHYQRVSSGRDNPIFSKSRMQNVKILIYSWFVVTLWERKNIMLFKPSREGFSGFFGFWEPNSPVVFNDF